MKLFSSSPLVVFSMAAVGSSSSTLAVSLITEVVSFDSSPSTLMLFFELFELALLLMSDLADLVLLLFVLLVLPDALDDLVELPGASVGALVSESEGLLVWTEGPLGASETGVPFGAAEVGASVVGSSALVSTNLSIIASSNLEHPPLGALACKVSVALPSVTLLSTHACDHSNDLLGLTTPLRFQASDQNVEAHHSPTM